MKSVTIPNSWSPEQALAVADFCDRLCALIWDTYGDKILDRLDDIARRSLDTDRLRQLTLPLVADGDIPF